MVNLVEIRNIITPFCKPIKNSNNVFSFEIDTAKLEEELGKNSDLHVIGLDSVIQSRVPTLDDIPILSEFVFNRSVMEELLDGNVQIIILNLYSDKEGTYKIKEFGKVLESEDVFNRLNNPDKIDRKLVARLVTDLPCYRILIIKRYVEKGDKLTYSTRIRYNKAMAKLYSELHSEPVQNEEDKDQDGEVLTVEGSENTENTSKN